MDRNIIKIEYFFQLDTLIKEIVSELFPNILNPNNIDELESYEKKLLSSLDRIEISFDRITKLLDLNENINNQISQLFENYRRKIKNCPLEYDNLKEVFLQIFVNMDFELTHKVNEELIGYSINKNLFMLLLQVTSITELLHVLHSYVVNNEEIMQSCGLLNSNDTIKLYGKNTNISQVIFDNLKKGLNSSEITILSINDNHIIIMLRDYGHATTIDININEDVAWINYFIPKICNYLMVQSLPGVSDVNENSKWAKGTIMVNVNELGNYLNDFIKKIPTDDDMFKIGGLAYDFAKKNGLNK